MRKILQLISPAKLNLRLDILNKRDDGYHEIRTLFQKINLHDTLFFVLTKERGIRIQTDHPNLHIGRKNLIYKSADSILKRSKYRGGILIQIKKRIPIGAGLGGGSSNAAITLRALNQLFCLGLSQEELMEVGLKIGADVPFFIYEGESAIASGIGERLERVEIPRLFYVLIYPNFGISTHWAYQNFVLTKKEFHFNLRQLSMTPQGISSILWNDLEEVVSKRYPEIKTMKEMLLSVGALGSLMTGSGPTVFGIFPDEETAKEGGKRIRGKARKKGWRVFQTCSLIC
ncbi:MAG: 4-(cytidine 5'-diphospho)-2-C-methyl-D-erythritol kinase [Thermodesulfobacteriota bacterium]